MLAGKSTRRWGTMNTVGNKIPSLLNINNRENVRLSESHWQATKTAGSQQWREKPSSGLTRRTVSSSWKPTNKLSEASQQMAHRLLTLCPPLHVSLPSFQMPYGTVKAKSDATSAISCRGLLCSDAQSCPTFCDPMYCIARQAPLSMGFPRQWYWSGLPFPPPWRGSSGPRD